MNGWKQVVVAILFLMISAPAWASYPAAIWAHPEVVTLLPDAESPQQIRIEGYFMVTEVPGKWGFAPVVHGWMLFECPAGKMDQCLLNWKDLVAKVGTCLGFGDMNEFPGTVHPMDQTEAEPDLYPLGLGVVPGFTPCQQLDEGIAELKAQETTEDAGSAPDLDSSDEPILDDAENSADDAEGGDTKPELDADGSLVSPEDTKEETDAGENAGDSSQTTSDVTKEDEQDTLGSVVSPDVTESADLLGGDLQQSPDSVLSVDAGLSPTGDGKEDKSGCETTAGPLTSPWTTVMLLVAAIVWVTSIRRRVPTSRQVD
ncbi:MAG: hypothetical protein HUU55_06700 [Myxococcales bacterium]|nr:hypothetical protein [Myxococcales bacterium]